MVAYECLYFNDIGVATFYGILDEHITSCLAVVLSLLSSARHSQGKRCEP